MVNIADEVNHPLECFLLLGNADVLGDGACRVIGDGGNDASFFRAVTFVVDVALLRWGVESINVVEGRAKASFSCVTVAISLNLLSVLFQTIGRKTYVPK